MKIGERIKALRQKQDLTLAQLSQKSGVASGTLSRIENNKMQGTVTAHTKICEVLNISLAELYYQLDDQDKSIDGAQEKARTEHFVHSKGATYELLVSKTEGKKIMPLLIKLQPNGETQSEQTKPGIEKCIYLMTGKIDIILGSNTHELNIGDSLYFPGSLKHQIINKNDGESVAVCMISPPSL